MKGHILLPHPQLQDICKYEEGVNATYAAVSYDQKVEVGLGVLISEGGITEWVNMSPTTRVRSVGK